MAAARLLISCWMNEKPAEKERGREREKEGEREGGRERGREGRREGGKEGGKKKGRYTTECSRVTEISICIVFIIPSFAKGCMGIFNSQEYIVWLHRVTFHSS